MIFFHNWSFTICECFVFLKRGTRVCAAGCSRGRSSRRERDCTVFIRTEFTSAATRIPSNLPRHPCTSFQHAFLFAYSQVCLMSALHGAAWGTPSCAARANRNQLGFKAKFSNFLSSLTSDWWKLAGLGSVLQCRVFWRATAQPMCKIITFGLNSLLLIRDKMSLNVQLWSGVYRHSSWTWMS